MTPEDVLLSESQERMLLVCEPAKFAAIAAVFSRWDLDAVTIGEVTEKKTVELFWKNERLTEIDPDLLVENAPQYQRPWKEWTAPHRVATRTGLVPVRSDWTATLLETLNDVRGTTREWIYRQYDSRVGASTARDCRDSVGIVRLKDSKRALGIVLGCRPHIMRFDAQMGGLDAVAYPALELALKGFETLAVTDCLNFGNPERENVMSEFVASVRAMSAVCEGLQAPIISGNVSFYNETMGKNITSTPSTGLVGLRGGVENLPLSHFAKDGATVYLLRLPGLICGGALQESTAGQVEGLGSVTTEGACAMVRVARILADVTGVQSTRVVGKFGLAYALARMSTEGVGARIEFEALKNARGGELDGASLFEEHLYEAVFAVEASDEARFEAAFAKVRTAEIRSLGLDLHRIGRTVPGRLEIGGLIESDTSRLAEKYNGGWKNSFEAL